MRATKRNPFWGEGLDKRQARRFRRRVTQGRPTSKNGLTFMLDEFASMDWGLYQLMDMLPERVFHHEGETVNTNDMTEAEYDAEFQPIESPGQEEGSHLWTRKEVQDALAAGTITEQQVWTVVDDGEFMCATAGWHAVNFLGYNVTTKSWVTETECATLHEYEDEEEDGAPCCPDPGCGGSPCTFPGYAANH